MSDIEDLLKETDVLRLRHIEAMRRCFGKTVEEPAPTKDIVQRVLVCDAAEGETAITDFGALLKLLKTNKKNMQHQRNKSLAYAMRNGKVNIEKREEYFTGKTDLEIITYIEEETRAILEEYTGLIKKVKLMKKAA
ncbi:MAG TPA: hypothetical protein O0X97_01875 [Methanocorpusculum sp.]|nr:hypothetical protein [Methanocorpusculum sp.]